MASPLKQKQIPTSVYFFSISLSLLSFSLVFLSFRDTKFWFLFSNAIIFFIAADSNAFSPKPDLYDEFLKHRNRGPYWVPSYNASSPQKTNEKKPKETKENSRNATMENAIVVVKEEIVVPDSKEESRDATSEKAIVVVKEENVVSACDKTLEHSAPVSCQDDYFSTISDEELNRRVEEFIRRVNREIRLQEIRERQALRV